MVTRVKKVTSLSQRKSDESMLSDLVEVKSLIVVKELTTEEERDLLVLERKVERAFYEAGKALAEIRNRRLYRSTHETFEAYCQERFCFTRRHINYRIAGYRVVQNLKMGTNCSQIFPTNESQVRPLTQLSSDEQVEAWQQALEQNHGKVPPARIVKDVVQRIRERRPVPNPYRVGDVCAIIVKENPDLKGYGGAWAIISEVHQFSCTVQLWNGVKQVRLEHLKELVYSPQQKTDLQALATRLNQLPINSLETAIKAFLAGLGKLNRTWLTCNEEGMLYQILFSRGVIKINS